MTKWQHAAHNARHLSLRHKVPVYVYSQRNKPANVFVCVKDGRLYQSASKQHDAVIVAAFFNGELLANSETWRPISH